MPIELTIILVLTLVSGNYWIWVFSKKEFMIINKIESPSLATHKGNVEMMELPKYERPKVVPVPLPDPAALMKKAPKTSFGSRTKSDQ